LLGKVLLVLTILLRIALYPLRRVAALLFPPGEFDGLSVPGISDRAARSFVADFRKAYFLPASSTGRRGSGGFEGGVGAESADGGPAECPFEVEGYRSTLGSIVECPSSQSPLLLVYVHSPLHRDAGKFASETLCNHSVARYLSEESLLRCFGASVHSADGVYVSNLLGVGSFPYVALLQVKGGSGGNLDNVSMELLIKMEGPALLQLRPRQFLAYIETCVTAHRNVLAEAEARRLQREEEARLREEQDREYRETLEADRRREAARREEEERVAEEERRRAEEELETERAKSNKIEDALAAVGEEPPHRPGETARIRLTLPSGRKVDRRFHKVDTVGTVRAFLIIHFHENDIPIENFSLSTSYPKKTYEDDSLSLEDGGLCPQAVLMVQDLDA